MKPGRKGTAAFAKGWLGATPASLPRLLAPQLSRSPLVGGREGERAEEKHKERVSASLQ